MVIDKSCSKKVLPKGTDGQAATCKSRYFRKTIPLLIRKNMKD